MCVRLGGGGGGVVKGHVKELPLPTHPSAGVFKYSCVLYSRNHCSMTTYISIDI